MNNVLDVRDGTHSTPKYVNKGVPLLTSKNLVDGKLVKEPSKLISIEDSLEINKRSKVDKNDILLAMIGTIGNPVLVPKISYDFSVKNIAIFKNMNSLNMKYIYFFIVYHTNELKKNASGAVQSFVSLTRLRNIIIPLPPLSEQQRIVEAIESALEKVDEYAESYNRLEQLDKEFPDKLKKSILQYAMQGKLVEQDPNDESVEVLLEKIRAEKQKLFEEGKIKKKDLEISIVSQGDDNSYYEEVPNTWQLFKLKNLLQLDNGTKQQNERLIYWDVKTLRGIKDAEFKEKGNKVHSKDTVILVDGENSGELFIIPHDGYMGSTFKKIHYLEAGSKKYIDLYIDSKKELLKNSKTGSAIPHLNKTLFKELIVALPPIQEQKRISSKITQIFSQINRLI
ncbi:restriction endonuclease subunit S [Streptococcus infantis]|nr:restriction endonuclease subunit S [Streptococcus infantis]